MDLHLKTIVLAKNSLDLNRITGLLSTLEDTDLTGFLNEANLLSTLEDTPPHLIITDLNAQDTLALLPKIKTFSAHTAILPLLHETEKNGITQLVQSGITEIITKPLIEDYFKLRVQMCLEKIRLEKAALIDSTSSLWNRKALQQELDRIESLSRRYDYDYAVMMVDLPKISSLSNHANQKKALKEMGKAIKTFIRKSDYASRFTENQFLIILPFTCQEGARKMGERFLEVLKNNNSQKDPSSFISPTIAVSKKCPDDDIMRVIKKTEKSLAFAREQNAFIIDSTQLEKQNFLL